MKLALPSRFRDRLGPMAADVSVEWFDSVDGCCDAVADAEVLWAAIETPSRMATSDYTRIVQAGPHLCWIHSSGAGTERHPLELYRRRGLIFTNGSGISAVPIAEHVVLVMLAAAKALPVLVRAQARSEWLTQGVDAVELFGSRALILGYGAIGSAIGDRLRPFGVHVTGVRRRPAGEDGVIGIDQWRSRLAEFDWVIVSVILTRDTRHLVGAPELAAMRSTAWLVNISRGAVIDQQALLSALRAGAIGGACLDVTDPEPLPAGDALWRQPNLILTPHSSWTSPSIDARAARLFLDLLEQYRAGAQLPNTVDLATGHRVT